MALQDEFKAIAARFADSDSDMAKKKGVLGAGWRVVTSLQTGNRLVVTDDLSLVHGLACKELTIAFPTAVNSQITDSVTQSNTKIVGDVPAAVTTDVQDDADTTTDEDAEDTSK